MGMITSVATNMKSRLSQFNQQASGSASSPSSSSSQQVHHSHQSGQQGPKVQVQVAMNSPARSTSSGSETATGSGSFTSVKRHSLGEQPASVIPLTVPGADSTMPSFPYGKLALLLYLIIIFISTLLVIFIKMTETYFITCTSNKMFFWGFVLRKIRIMKSSYIYFWISLWFLKGWAGQFLLSLFKIDSKNNLCPSSRVMIKKEFLPFIIMKWNNIELTFWEIGR